MHLLAKEFMAAITQRVLALVIATSMAACTSLQPLPHGNAAGTGRAQRQAQSIAIGNAVTVNPKLGAAFELVVTAVHWDLMAGTEAGKARQVMFSDIESIEQKRFDMLHTALIVLGVIALRQYAKGISQLTNP